MLFNGLAPKADLHWEANSRGLEPSIYNIGPVYPFVLERLETLGIQRESNIRTPIRLEVNDLQEAGLIVALDEAEHRPMMVERFMLWADRIQYWNIPDLHQMNAEEAFSQIEQEIAALIQHLQNH